MIRNIISFVSNPPSVTYSGDTATRVLPLHRTHTNMVLFTCHRSSTGRSVAITVAHTRKLHQRLLPDNPGQMWAYIILDQLVRCRISYTMYIDILTWTVS